MIDHPSADLARLIVRNSELEARYTHLQRVVDELNGVVIDQAQRLDGLERRLLQLATQLGRLTERDAEPRSLEDDKPPHY